MRGAVGFLTILGGPREPSDRSLRWFPAVGAALGGLLGAMWWLSDQAFSTLVAAAIVVAVDVALTGGLHFDGLADAADGLLPHVPRERRLEIMHTPGVGAFALVAVSVAVVLRVAALGSMPVDVGLIVAVWCASRTVAAVAPAWLPYVRDEGLASALVASPARWPALALAPAIALAVVTIGAPGLAAVIATVVGAVGVLWLGRMRVGGFTGDVLGAAIVVGETVGLVVAGARW
jgi:adenosylcobinamide-GDP ribazoletransferase